MLTARTLIFFLFRARRVNPSDYFVLVPNLLLCVRSTSLQGPECGLLLRCSAVMERVPTVAELGLSQALRANAYLRRDPTAHAPDSCAG